MTMLQVNSAIELNQVLKGIETLDTPELEQFLSQVSVLLAKRKASSLPQTEVLLLQKINIALPVNTLTEYQALTKKQQSGHITEQENERLLELVDIIELADAQRMQHLLELARLRNLPLDTLMQQLGIQPPQPHA